MSNLKLSKDADALICLIYKHYLDLRNDGISKSEAKLLGSSENLNTIIIPEWSFDDVDDTCRELDRANFLSIIYASDTCSEIFLTDDGIVYMENRFQDKIKNLIDYIAVIKFW